MVPELDFSTQRQWFPKNCDKNTVWHSQKLKVRKFPSQVPLLLKWKCYTEHELKLGNSHEIAPSALLPLIWLLCGVFFFFLLKLWAGFFRKQDEGPFDSTHLHRSTCSFSDVVIGEPCSLVTFQMRYADRKVTTKGDKTGLFLRVQ